MDPGGSTFDAATLPFVGRQAELGELRAALDVALAGGTRGVLISGEPGIGKTRLAAVLAHEAASRGAPVWWGRCSEDRTAPPFWPWNTALRDGIRHAGRQAADTAAGDLLPDLARVFPALRTDGPEPPSVNDADSERARFRLFDVVSRFVAHLSRPHGLVIVLDDLHWADAPSLKLLDFLVADLPPARLLLLAAYRDAELRSGHPLLETLSRVAREPAIRRLSLAGLSEEDCVEYVARAGAAADSTPLGAVLRGETDGNPFFLSEIVHLLRREHRLDVQGAARALPVNVSAALSRRLDRLGGDGRSVLAVGALLGNPFDGSVLQEVAERCPAPVPLSVAAVVDAAVRDRLVREVEGQPGLFAFSHALVRRVLVDELATSERATWHAWIAAVLEERVGSPPDAASTLVRHFTATGTADGLRKAFEYACRGAERAAQQLGWEESVRLYQTALEVGARCGALDRVRAMEIEIALAHALRQSGDVAGARARCRELVPACERAGRPDLLARAALVHAGPVSEFGRVDPEVRAILERACRVGDELDDAQRARLYARLAGDLVTTNAIDRAPRLWDLCEKAAQAARRAGDPGALALALLPGFYGRWLGATPPEGMAVPKLRELIELTETAGDLGQVAQLRHLRAQAFFSMGEAQRCWAEHDAIATVSAASRIPEACWLADADAALRAIVEGRFDDGQRLAEQALATGERFGLPNAPGVHLAQRFMWSALTGQVAELLPLFDEFVHHQPGGAAWRPMRALARWTSGDEAGARAEYQILLAAGAGSAEGGFDLRAANLACMAALCAALHARDTAPALFELTARRPETWVTDRCATLGPWALFRGMLASVCGRPGEAVAQLDDAVHAARRLGSAPFVAHAQVLLAGALLADGTREAAAGTRAAECLDEAERLASDLGLGGVQARAERLRARLGTVPREANVWRRDRGVWTIEFGGTTVHLRDARGLHHLAQLLVVPGRELHVLQLVEGPREPARAGMLDGLTIKRSFHADLLIDTRARAEFRERLHDLREELAEAEGFSDQGRCECLRAEIDQLTIHLGGHFGRHASRMRDEAETARKAVTKAIRTQIRRLEEDHPALRRHLDQSVRTGIHCVYLPPTPTCWEL